MSKTKCIGLCLLLAGLLLSGCGQSDDITREGFTGEAKSAMYQAAENILMFLPGDFDYDSMILFQDGDGNVVGLAARGNRGFLAGNSVNVERMTTCSLYEVVSINGEDIAFPNMKCGASASLDGPELTLKGIANCDVCGMGASIDGMFTRFAEIAFAYGEGTPKVKRVYKLL
jgi:hypothetical protein